MFYNYTINRHTRFAFSKSKRIISYSFCSLSVLIIEKTVRIEIKDPISILYMFLMLMFFLHGADNKAVPSCKVRLGYMEQLSKNVM